MKKFLLLLIGLVLYSTIQAQDKVKHYQVSGQVTERITGNGVPFATVIISNDSINLKKAQACDVSGRFSFDLDVPIRYNLTISSVGFKEFTLPVLITELKTVHGYVLLCINCNKRNLSKHLQGIVCFCFRIRLYTVNNLVRVDLDQRFLS